MTHLKQGISRFALIFSLLFVLSSATPINMGDKEKDLWAINVTMQTTSYAGDCAITITQVVTYYFNNFFILVAAQLNGPAHLTITCGQRNPFLYEIRAADVGFDIGSGDITGIDFEAQSDDTVNDIITNVDFLVDYKSWVNSEKP